MSDEHHYRLTTTWTGNRGTGTSGYRDYERSVSVEVSGKPVVIGSADKPFRGDPQRWNPEDLLVAALSQCHLLSYLHACVVHGVVVTHYRDEASGTLVQRGNGGAFRDVLLRPQVVVADASMIEAATSAHHDAHEWCFIANSVNFPVRVEPTIRARANPAATKG
ncbi:MAG TPA: OsmC family protein [Micropruina sp.]|nr:OsmC family protein [Micropruina sp.]